MINMLCFRRFATRAISSPPQTFTYFKPRSITTLTSRFSRITHPSYVSPLQRRFASDGVQETEQGNAEAPKAPETTSVEEFDVTDIQQSQAPTTASTDGLYAANTQEPQAADTRENVRQNMRSALNQDEPSTLASTISSAAENASSKASEIAGGVATASRRALDEASGLARGQGTTSTESGTTEYPAPRNQVYVGNLFFDVTESDLSREMGRFGTVKSVRIIYDGRGLSKGFGYVEFADELAAAAAIENLHQQVFEGRRMIVQYVKYDRRDRTRVGLNQKAMNPPSKTLFIGNMAFDMSDQDLNDLFRQVKNVIDVRVAIDRRTGQPRGFAHADFIDVASAEKAMEVLQGKSIYGRRLRIDFSTSAAGSSRMEQQSS